MFNIVGLLDNNKKIIPAIHEYKHRQYFDKTATDYDTCRQVILQNITNTINKHLVCYWQEAYVKYSIIIMTRYKV